MWGYYADFMGEGPQPVDTQQARTTVAATVAVIMCLSLPLGALGVSIAPLAGKAQGQFVSRFQAPSTLQVQRNSPEGTGRGEWTNE